MAKIIWTYEAEHWLNEIYQYIAKENPLAAKNTINQIYNKTQALLDQPKIGYKYKNESNNEIRVLLHKHYRITYLINKEKDIIILGVFHGSLQIQDYIQI